jgi:hypothetical protein
MAQPQGLNVPSIITTGIVGVILTMAVIEGVRAYYYRLETAEEAQKWNNIPVRDKDTLRTRQMHAMQFESKVPIDKAMQQLVQSGGKLPANMAKPDATTRPAATPTR